MPTNVAMRLLLVAAAASSTHVARGLQLKRITHSKRIASYVWGNKKVRPVRCPSMFSSIAGNKVESNRSDREQDNPSSAQTKRTTVPVTLLAGFLGSGKTSAIQHLLSNTNDLKIGVIVNDVASVNIDAKLLKRSSTLMDDESTDATSQIVPSNRANWIELQNGCVCCSIQDEWMSAVETLLSQQSGDGSGGLDAIVVELSGVADPLALQNQWQSSVGSTSVTTDLTFRIVTMVDACTFGTDYYTWDLVLDRPQWKMSPEQPDIDELLLPDSRRKVSELLAEQVEAAHAILVNKMDLASSVQSATAMAMVRALNPTANVTSSEFGQISPGWILGHVDLDGPTMSVSTPVDVCHSHAHDASHSHKHEHHHGSQEASCANPSTCTDPTHHHDKTPTLSVQNLGIVSFVYKSSRPFDMVRLRALLNQWPVPVQDSLEITGVPSATSHGAGIESFGTNDNPFHGILRSKGFCWTAPQFWAGAHSDAWRHETAMFWSHAGRQMGISTAGKWWASIPDAKMQSYFVDNRNEYDRIQAEDFVSDEFGDRRQEIVFIGTNLNQEAITCALDECLYNDGEMETYRQKLRNFMDMRFSATGSSSRGLFGVGSFEHADL